MNRIFEYEVNEQASFCGQTTTALYWLLHENFGHAGLEYVRWLVKNVAKIKPGIEQVRVKLDADAGIRGEERFWSAVAAAALYGGAVAKALGLIKFDLAPVMLWVTKAIHNMRGDKIEQTGSAVDILGQFLDEHAANSLLVKGDCSINKPAVPIETPRGPLVIRHEIDNQKLFFSRAVFRSWLSKHFGSYTKIAGELKALGALRDGNTRKVLGAGTSYGGAQQPCWLIDLRCPGLGIVGLSLVQEAKNLEKAVGR
jgi:hypothetical protein